MATNKADAWLGTSAPLSAWEGDEDRSSDTARRIAEKSTSITIRREGSALAAQAVRIEVFAGGSRGGQNPVAEKAQRAVLVLGYKNHATITDTDLQRGDRFIYQDQEYVIDSIDQTIAHQIQAAAHLAE